MRNFCLGNLLFDKGTVSIRRSEVNVDAGDQVAREGKELSVPELHSLVRVSAIGNEGFVPFDENAFKDILTDTVAVGPAALEVGRTVNCIVVGTGEGEGIGQQLLNRLAILQLICFKELL